MNYNIIGPICSGKTELSYALADNLKIQRISFDHIKYFYFYKNGYNSLKGKNLEIENYRKYLDYIEEFEVQALEGISKEFKNSIIDLGGGVIRPRKKYKWDYIKNILNRNSHLILLLPNQNINSSYKILKSRLEKRAPKLNSNTYPYVENHYVTTRCIINNEILKQMDLISKSNLQIFYTDLLSQKEIVDSILQLK